MKHSLSFIGLLLVLGGVLALPQAVYAKDTKEQEKVGAPQTSQGEAQSAQQVNDLIKHSADEAKKREAQKAKSPDPAKIDAAKEPAPKEKGVLSKEEAPAASEDKK